MSNNVLVVDPFMKAVMLRELEPGRSILDQIRDIVGCQLLTTIKPAPQTILWIDNLGLLKGGDQRFWRMRDSAVRFAGRTVMTAVDQHGMPMPVAVDTAAFERNIDWCEGARIERVWEELHVEMHSEMGPWPRVVPMVEFAGDPPKVEDLNIERIEVPVAELPVVRPPGGFTSRYWIVFEDDADDTFHCRERQTNDEGEGDWTGEEVRFETLVEVHQFAAERGLKFVLREVKDPAGVAGTMVQP